ncbi:hypothetical protein LWI28_019562 [Acer negundo]|uniref:Proteasome alpha-type subunits domain-containing protein n=1 Tax=Acer negundo TaxID=4023 RepID=A0AAD5JTI1_ACENE|nr:hypothetical protein LWI28_019562 [Acer negundo]
MSGRRLLGGTLIPANDEIDRVGYVARQFEELDPFVEEMGDRGAQRNQVIQAEREVQDRQGAQESPPSSPRRGLGDDIKIMRKHDSRTTTFSPEGRIYQVEYAIEAIRNVGSTIGILAKDGVVLVDEKKVTFKLLQTSTSTEKMYKIDDHVTCAVAGIMFDANILINTAKVQTQ